MPFFWSYKENMKLSLQKQGSIFEKEAGRSFFQTLIKKWSRGLHSCGLEVVALQSELNIIIPTSVLEKGLTNNNTTVYITGML
ncbi:hypothetical protein L6452_06476 [Arctium lappa]|uniref:Uncharacterized protein n=1 Tax=Arctium lappa TaxID=4217 RepID=A0ACB9EIN0_ARCLA|nr:hypothetical protein L6452_06476 [Arctium lappa]